MRATATGYTRLDMIEHAFDTVPGVETIERWCNGHTSTDGRCDLVLRFNRQGPLWEIEARAAGRSRVFEFPTEVAARHRMASMLGPGWRQVATEARPAGASRQPRRP
jgi:hypothetical protein